MHKWHWPWTPIIQTTEYGGYPIEVTWLAATREDDIVLRDYVISGVPKILKGTASKNVIISGIRIRPDSANDRDLVSIKTFSRPLHVLIGDEIRFRMLWTMTEFEVGEFVDPQVVNV